MKRAFVAVTLLVASLLGVRADDDPNAHTFEGTGKVVTPLFVAADHWEVRWSQASSMNITVADAGGTIIAGAGAAGNGSLYFPTAGTYYLVVSGTPAAGASAWKVSIVPIGPNTRGSAENYLPPTELTRPSRVPGGAVQVIPQTADGRPLLPTIAETHATVRIVGDTGEANGILAHAPDGKPVVITNSHVISDNPNFKITTTDGRQVTVLGYRGAPDRDVVMMTIRDDGFSYIDLIPDVSRVPLGDPYLVPGNVGGGETYLATSGQVKAIEPDRVEISTPIFRGPPGGPVIEVATGKVLGAVCLDMPVRNPADLLAIPSLPNPKAALEKIEARYAVRVDNVTNWETYDLNEFLAEARFLHEFHRQTRILDSFLNGELYEKAGLPMTAGDDGYFPVAQVYLKDERLHALAQAYHAHASDSDKSLQMEAARELSSGLSDIANSGMRQMEVSQSFYQFNRRCAAGEMAYRKAVIAEMEKAGDKIGDLVH